MLNAKKTNLPITQSSLPANSTIKPCDESSYPQAPHQLSSSICEAVGLTKEYRNELDELTRYIQKSKPSNEDAMRFLINLILQA